MIRTTLLFAAALIGVGVFFYFDTGREIVTALIPAFIGVALGVCALLGRNPELHMHVMHVAVLLSVATADEGVTLDFACYQCHTDPITLEGGGFSQKSLGDLSVKATGIHTP